MESYELLPYVMDQFYDLAIDRYVVPCKVKDWYLDMLRTPYSFTFEAVMYKGKLVTTHCELNKKECGAHKNKR